MRRTLTIILTLIYLGLSSGTPLHAHYCMGHLMSVAIWMESDECTNCCTSDSDDNCCDDKTEWLKLTDNQNKPAKQNIQYSPQSLETTINNQTEKQYPKNIVQTITKRYCSSAGAHHPPLYIRNCVYRI